MTVDDLGLVDMDGKQLVGLAPPLERDPPPPGDHEGRSPGEGGPPLPSALRDGLRDHRPRPARLHHPGAGGLRRHRRPLPVRDAGDAGLRRDRAALRPRAQHDPPLEPRDRLLGRHRDPRGVVRRGRGHLLPHPGHRVPPRGAPDQDPGRQGRPPPRPEEEARDARRALRPAGVPPLRPARVPGRRARPAPRIRRAAGPTPWPTRSWSRSSRRSPTRSWPPSRREDDLGPRGLGRRRGRRRRVPDRGEAPRQGRPGHRQRGRVRAPSPQGQGARPPREPGDARRPPDRDGARGGQPGRRGHQGEVRGGHPGARGAAPGRRHDPAAARHVPRGRRVRPRLRRHRPRHPARRAAPGRGRAGEQRRDPREPGPRAAGHPQVPDRGGSGRAAVHAAGAPGRLPR